MSTMRPQPDQTNPDPYLRTFRFPKWNRFVRATDEPSLLRRMPEFAGWTKQAHHTVAIDFMAQSIARDELWAHQVGEAILRHGDGNGVLISGVYREHFPEDVKSSLRALAHGATFAREKSCAHWQAAGKRMSTWRAEYQRMRQ